MSTDRLDLIEPTRPEISGGSVPPSVVTLLIFRWTVPWPTDRFPVATTVVEIPATDTGSFTCTSPSGIPDAVAFAPPTPDVFISFVTPSQPRLVVPVTSSAVIWPMWSISALVDAFTPLAVTSSTSSVTPWLLGWSTWMVIWSYRPRATWVRNGNPLTDTVGSLGEVMFRAASSFFAWSAMVRSAAYAATRSTATNRPTSTTSTTIRLTQTRRPRLAAMPS